MYNFRARNENAVLLVIDCYAAEKLCGNGSGNLAYEDGRYWADGNADAGTDKAPMQGGYRKRC